MTAQGTRYIVMISSAHMPSKVKAPYRHVALVETDLPAGHQPKMISSRARGVVRIVEMRERQHLGFRPRGNTAAERAQRELAERARELNAQ